MGRHSWGWFTTDDRPYPTPAADDEDDTVEFYPNPRPRPLHTWLCDGRDPNRPQWPVMDPDMPH